MSNVDENEDGSDEDMFSPKKNRCKIETAVVPPVNRPPGCKERLVNTFKRMLTGVPPPPDYTNPDFHLDKMLTHWKENQNLVWGDGNDTAHGSAEMDTSRLGICLNTDDSCEELELLGRQICERYIWSETNAVTSSVYVKLTQSAKKRRKANGWGLSPRTRISYLTRRMTTFQKDNIAAAVASNKTAQILIAKGDVKRGAAGKNNLKGKRALFLSPENQNKFQTPEQGKDRKLVRRLLLNCSPPRSDSSACSGGRGSAKSLEKRRCSRSLFSSKTEPLSDQKSAPVNQNQQSNALSTQHRQKMLWAVSNALKAVKIRMTDSEFKTYAGPLFKATTEKWRSSLNSPAGDKKASTSDTMLAAAKSLVEGITGRKMSPKSAKKNPTLRMRTKTPDKSGKRDENSPPSSANPSTPIKDSADAGVFPLDHVDILAEKLGPGGNTNTYSIPIMNSSRKRKLDDERDTEPSSILVSPRALRMRTPSKPNGVTPKKLTFHPSVVDGTPSKHINDSPLAKKRKLTSSATPTKVESNLTRSPRVLRSRAPSTLESAVVMQCSDVVTPKKTRSSPLKCTSSSGNSGKINTTPNKFHSEDVEMASPRVLRMRTPSKIVESLEGNRPRSQGVSPMKLRSTPSKLSPRPKNIETCSDSDSMALISQAEIKSILTPPRVFRTITPSRVAPSSETSLAKKTPKKVLFAPIDEKSCNPDGISQPCLELPPARRTLLTPQAALSARSSPSSSYDEKSKNFLTDDDNRGAKNLTSSAKRTRATPPRLGDEAAADPLPPVLRPEAMTVRRSSRTFSVEIPPPVLKMEISDAAQPPPDLGKRIP